MKQTLVQAIAGVGGPFRVTQAPGYNPHGFLHLRHKEKHFPLASGPIGFIRAQFIRLRASS